ncbi:hypothetical protein NM688_g3963 [Phlebia brevispora]|uniref:Uncharacterized protein n=1 Tax=Phlebia brevispora TaxID=194682 RepID=A0ACC1T3Z7_9APHY|nr:hypothetical protein NM688_g3963 [Phlebia brevispora]
MSRKVNKSKGRSQSLRTIGGVTKRARLAPNHTFLRAKFVTQNKVGQTLQWFQVVMESVVLETSLGDIQLELYWDHAPRTCKNFVELARRGYYNGIIFHRIISDFMVQGGDPTGTGRGGTSIYGQKFEDEIHPELRFTGAGILAMANSGPNTNGSHFFLTLAPTPYLDNKHTIFGRVSSGMRVLQRLGAVATDAQDRPREDVKIHRARVV